MSGKRWHLGALVAVLALLMAMLAAVPTTAGAEVEELDPPERPDDPPVWTEDSFDGYTAPSDIDEADAVDKTEDFGDVPADGSGGPAADDESADLVQPGEAVGDSADDLREAVALAEAGDQVDGSATPDGRLRVVVTMNEPIAVEADLSPAEVDAQRDRFAASIGTLEGLLAGTGSTVGRAYDVLPSAAAALDSAGLENLLASADVAAITIDRVVEGALDVSTGVISSDDLNAAGVLGNNFPGSGAGAYQVAVLDSGVRNDHQAFVGRIVDQACFSGLAFGPFGDCPDGSSFQLGGNAGTHCTYTSGIYAAECEHGTHVASIAAGNAFSGGGHEGVAQGAEITAVQVGHATPAPGGTRWTAYTSDIDFGLQYVYLLQTNPAVIPVPGGPRNLAAVNLSLGGGLYTNACDGAFPGTANLMGLLDSVQVASVVSAGNDASTSQVSYPGCISTAYTVSATDDVDVPAGFSNSNALTNWWAPGVSINAAISTGTTARANKSGTSMSAPHVAGSFALLRECVGLNTDEDVANRLNATGVNITRAGVTRKRIDVLDAATGTVDNNLFANAEILAGDGPFDIPDFNVCADTEPGEPSMFEGPFPLSGFADNSIWWEWTPASTGTATISTDDGGGNVTTFDTELWVFEDGALNSLNQLAYDDDGGVGLRSLITLPVNGGQTYRIRVDGYDAANGLLNLHVENGPPPTCDGLGATIVGTTGDDVIIGTPGADVIVAGAGNDFVDGLGSNDTICGGSGNDILEGGSGSDVVLGESGNDQIALESGNDAGGGGPGADNIAGGIGDDTIFGDVGNDIIDGDEGSDSLDGWDGDDLIRGGGDNDTLLGWFGNDTLNGNVGDDVIDGEQDDDLLGGQGGDDDLFGGPGDDDLFGDFDDDDLFGGPGNDFLRGSKGVDVLSGGDGIDDLQAGSEGDILDGGQGNDLVRGGGGDDSVDGGDDDDVVQGGTDNDTVSGNAGDDTVTGNANNDILNGGIGNDQLFGGPGFDIVNGEDGNDTMRGNDGADTLNGGNGNDQLFGDNGNDTVNGDAGDDFVNGGNNADTVNGGSGVDQVNGNAGGDTLNGGPDAPDTCNGGAGPDTTTGGCEVTINIP